MEQNSIKGPLILFCGLALAACSGSSGSSSGGSSGGIDPGLSTDSRIVELNQDGTLPDVGIDQNNSLTVSNITNNGGFAYQIGRVSGADEFLGVAGVTPNTRVGNVPTAANATYSGEYSLAYADRNEFGDPVSGAITLSADFNNRTLTGQSGGLNVNGTLDGQSIGGTASYRGVDADLTGRIGTSRAIGAFAGHTADAVLTGGFIAEAN